MENIEERNIRVIPFSFLNTCLSVSFSCITIKLKTKSGDLRVGSRNSLKGYYKMVIERTFHSNGLGQRQNAVPRTTFRA